MQNSTHLKHNRELGAGNKPKEPRSQSEFNFKRPVLPADRVINILDELMGKQRFTQLKKARDGKVMTSLNETEQVSIHESVMSMSLFLITILSTRLKQRVEPMVPLLGSGRWHPRVLLVSRCKLKAYRGSGTLGAGHSPNMPIGS